MKQSSNFNLQSVQSAYSTHNLFARQKVGRPRRYPIDFIKIDEYVLFPWESFDMRNATKELELLNAAIRQEERRFGKRFIVSKELGVFRVTRVL